MKDKIATLTKKQAIELLAKNGKLIKRPFFINNKKGLVGFNEETWKTIV